MMRIEVTPYYTLLWRNEPSDIVYHFVRLWWSIHIKDREPINVKPEQEVRLDKASLLNCKAR